MPNSVISERRGRIFSPSQYQCRLESLLPTSRWHIPDWLNYSGTSRMLDTARIFGERFGPTCLGATETCYPAILVQVERCRGWLIISLGDLIPILSILQTIPVSFHQNTRRHHGALTNVRRTETRRILLVVAPFRRRRWNHI